MFASFAALRNPLGRLALLLSFLAAAACTPMAPMTGGNSGQRIDPGAPVQVALLVPQSASNGGASISQSVENAARMAVSDLNGAQVDLRVYDTAGDPSTASAAATRAADEGAKIVIGPVFSQAANAAGVALANRDVNILSLSNNTAIAGGNVFVLGNTFANTANRLVSYAAQNGRSNIYVIHGEDSAEIQGRDAIVQAINASRANLAGTGSFPLSQQGVENAAPRLAQEAQDAGADAVFLTSGSEGALPFLADQLPAAGLSPQTTRYIGLQRLDVPSSALRLDGLQGAWFALPDPGRVRTFEQRYADTYGSVPNPALGTIAYDAVAAVGSLVAQGNANALSRRALTQRQGFQGAGGAFRLQPNGTVERALAVAQIQNNQVVVIDPAPSGFGSAGF
ncbi:penicillin-binding protein activator [Tranquillimonas rosea]|uniref:penicillin-binding protein activator n=1 Tax=Tranquillimonas rosea TaxID=641238 RepID=UPI003BAD66B8